MSNVAGEFEIGGQIDGCVWITHTVCGEYWEPGYPTTLESVLKECGAHLWDSCRGTLEPLRGAGVAGDALGHQRPE